MASVTIVTVGSWTQGRLRGQGKKKPVKSEIHQNNRIQDVEGSFHFWKILILKRFDKVLVNKPHS